MEATQTVSIPRVRRVFSGPGIWVLLALFLPVTFLQLAAYLHYPAFLINLTANFGLTRYTVERILFLLPITWAGFSFGWKGGAITAIGAVAVEYGIHDARAPGVGEEFVPVADQRPGGY